MIELRAISEDNFRECLLLRASVENEEMCIRDSSGAFYMTDIELMIGQSSTEAERKRAARLENKALLPPRTKGGHLSDIRPPEIEIELEKEIEIEKEREGETGHPAAYGRYNNVILTDTCLLYTSRCV